ncbi:MAG TPA: hypothetical protein VNX21_06825, partial [Candidatus Thermoplasmatota archaeon]|nr:hypothetical protein [Candidatus Thermoplasmatota archaeon]
SPGPASLRLLVSRDGEPQGDRDLGVRDLPAGTARVELPFLPAEGPGAYAVALAVDGAAGAPLRFDAHEAGATARVTWVVPDEPTRLALLDDPVNADGKLKSPGEAVVTRLRVEDANGMADVRALAWHVLQGAAVVESGALALAAAPNATGATVEHRHARVPLAAGEYLLVLRANGAEARRTFAIRDVAPTLAALRLDNVTPDAETTLRAEALLADRNGWSADAALEARVYRGSARLPWAVALDAPRVQAENATFALAVTVPAGAAPGPHRVSLYAAGALVGSAGFEVLPVPRLAGVAAEPRDDALALHVNLTAPGLVDVLLAGDGAALRTTRALPAGASTLALDAPADAPRLRWNVTLRAREGGPALGHAEGEWRRDLPRPVLDLQPVRVHPAPAWRVAAAGWDLAGAEANVTLVRWDGQPVEPRASFDGERLALGAPLEPGRYAMTLTLRLPNGTRAAAQASFDVAPWVRVALGEAVVRGDGTVVLPVHNAGAAVRGLVVEVEGLPGAPALEAGGASHAPRARAGRHVFDAPLAAGEGATLVLKLPQGPLASGAHEARVRVLALGART